MPARTRTTFARFALLAVLSAGSAVLGPPAVAADDPAGVTWGVRTATNAQGADRQNFTYSLAPGGRLDDAIVVTNHDDQAIALDVYAADAFTTESGQLDLVGPEDASTDAGTWIDMNAERIEVPAGASVEVPFSVAVPSNAIPGDHAAGVVTSLVVPGQADGITVDRRLGVRVQIRVQGPMQPAMVVSGLTVAYEPSWNPFAPAGATVSYTVRNVGNTRLSAQQSVALAGPFGVLRRDLPGVDDVPELLPGESWPVTARTSSLIPLFWLTGIVTLDPSGPAGAVGAPDLTLFETTAHTAAVPWSQLAVLLLVGGAVLVTWRLRRVAAARRRAAEEARVSAAVAEALATRTAPAVPQP
jgi:hypothetical protein